MPASTLHRGSRWTVHAVSLGCVAVGPVAGAAGDDLEEVVAKHPDVLGIGIDESTAIIVQGQQFEIVGASKVAIHDGRIVKGAQERNGKKYFFMGPGEKYDLTKLEWIGKPKVSEQH